MTDEDNGSRPQDPLTSVLVIGMAGSGKTTFTNRLFHYIHERSFPKEEKDDEAGSTVLYETPFLINLDPAVLDVPYPTDIDICEMIDYNRVMEDYKLGPNGAILTCLNLFTAQFDEVLTTIDALGNSNDDNNHTDEAKAEEKQQLVIFDTPGQIEIFTWSASGTIITETLAALHPTVIVYIVDTSICKRPVAFMSNMLYACSILYKTKLPFILVFNKVDDTDHHFAVEWMQDFETFQDVLLSDESYMGSFMNSMSLVLEEFYKMLRVVGVSSVTGEGFDDLLEAIHVARKEYHTDYLPYLDKASRLKKNTDSNLVTSSNNQIELGPDGSVSLQQLMRGIRLSKNDDNHEDDANNNDED